MKEKHSGLKLLIMHITNRQFQNEAKCKNCENEFHLYVNKSSFSYQWPCTYHRFETGAWGNSEMASFAKDDDTIGGFAQEDL